jgi:hypothetical protein
MREGLKKYTSYTNAWKNFPEEEKKISSKATKIAVTDLLSKSHTESGWKQVRGKPKEYLYDIELPKPPKVNKNRIIHFTKPDEEIKQLANFLFEDSDVNPSDVGQECFERTLKEIKGSKK